MNLTAFVKIATNLKLLLGLLVILTLIVAIQQFNIGQTHTWNAIIYKMSFYHLIHHQELYSSSEYYNGAWIDAYKYSPTFALLYAPLAILPLLANIMLWNLLNVIIFFFAVKSLPINDKKKSIIIWLTLLDLIISIQNSQSNVLIAGLIIFAFTAMERKKLLFATLCIVFSIYIKLFGIAALLLFFFYPGKIKFILYTIMWGTIFFLLPLLIVSFNELISIYKSWIILLKQDETISWGLSIMGILKSWFGLNNAKALIQMMGLLLLCIPLFANKIHSNREFRMLYLCSILIWVVTFNHRAESPSFIIALSGIAIWFVMQEPKPITTAFALFAIAITSLAHSDLLPQFFRINFVDAYAIKGLPSFVLWLIIQYKLCIMAFKSVGLQAQSSIGE
ncbi:MAG TPA: glycosyltransferase family 87 protein [Bacteroidia bacterium]|nr:glycosyltransferase family 87 protein [Bacteroidia bacterium]